MAEPSHATPRLTKVCTTCGGEKPLLRQNAVGIGKGFEDALG